MEVDIKDEWIHDVYDGVNLADVKSIANMFQKITDLIDAQISVIDINKLLKEMSKEFIKLTKSKDIDNDLNHFINILEVRVKKSCESTDRYYQIKRARLEIAKIKNEEYINKIFTKAATLKEEKVIIEIMSKEVKNIDIVKYLNGKYEKQLAENKLNFFSAVDISIYLKKYI